ncbi:HAMP domain-containing sensor histidine kinase [Streptosporangium sandarakinum]|uniref:HAMP domain-containing sensor histidine kinase n=1 Tax=Streptosporangium sandarakinum TaxID=1260955 RepID=UPI0033A1FD9B
MRVGGLRARMVVVFVLVSVISSVTATVLIYRQSRDFMLQRTQDAVMEGFRTRVTTLAREFDLPPDQAALRRFAQSVSPAVRDGVVIARYGGLTAASDAAADRTRITAALRAAVSDRSELSWQRVEYGGQPWFVVGAPVTFEPSGKVSGLEIYGIVPLSDEEVDTALLLEAAGNGMIIVAVAAILMALLAARAVLQPVRDLGRAARHLAEGALHSRAVPRGSDELTDLTHTFNQTAAALERTMGEVREQEARARRFVADVSHELRTPLAAMAMVTEVLDEDAAALPPDSARAARTVSAEVTKLTRLVEDLIEISRFDAGAAALNLADLDVAEAIKATLTARGWRDLHLELPPGIRARLDRRRLDVIVANLVGNALRHGVPPVSVRLRADGVRLEIEVADRGPGLDDEAIRHVFERFYKADAARTRSEGSGLGLAIAQENARLHGGEITVANRGGAVFTVRLPIEEPR